MTGKQNAVMWMGLLLIIANAVVSTQWHQLWNGTILLGSTSNANSNQAKKNLAGPNPLGNPGGGGQWWFPYMSTTGSSANQTSPPSASSLSA